MNNVLDVAHYIIRFHNKHNSHISKLKLQKLLYFVQVHFIMTLGIEKPCFRNDIIAFPYGPVVETILDEYSSNGRENLEWNENVNNIKYSDLIDEICRLFINDTAEKLVDLTHKQSPYKNAIASGIRTVISLESIHEYFNRIINSN